MQYIFDKVGGDVRANITYEDEFRNYIGKAEFWVEDGQAHFDIDEVDSDDLITTLEEWSGWDTQVMTFLGGIWLNKEWRRIRTTGSHGRNGLWFL